MSYYSSLLFGEEKYLIKLDGNLQKRCSQYKKIKIEIPFLSINKDKDSSEDFSIANLVLSFLGESEPTPAQKEVKYKDVVVLSCYSDESRIFFVSKKDRDAVMNALECGERCVDGDSYAESDYAKACSDLYKRIKWYSYSNDEEVVFLTECFKKKESVVIVDSVVNVISQFEEQGSKEQEMNQAKNKSEILRRELDALHERATEMARELEAKREKDNTEIAKKKEPYVELIKTKFEESQLLCRQSLTNKEKLCEYTAVRDFCCEYLPFLGEKGFKVETLLQHFGYLIGDVVSEDTYTTFKENWIRLSRSHAALTRGAIGESKVDEVLQLFDDRILILKEYTWDNEHDFIVITRYGISTIEVKNLHGNYELTETGMLKCLSNKKVGSKDIAFQSKKHLEKLRRRLKLCPAYNSNIPLQEIICSAEANFTIKDNYGYIPVCYYNTIDKYLLPKSGDEIMSVEQMHEIYEFLLKNRKEAFKFGIFYPEGEIDSRESFINSFAELAATYIAAVEVWKN